MKRIFMLPVLALLLAPISFSSCSVLKGYMLNEQDAAAAIRQMLEFGARDGIRGAFSKETIMQTVFPGSVGKVLNTINQLGLTNEVDRFTTTMTTAAEQTAEKSIPIFVSGIGRMSFTDAMGIVKNGGTSGTDYLRRTIGTELRQSITPVMKSALDEYKLYDQWAKIIKPVENLTGNKLNLDLANLMAGIISEKMFQKLEEKERDVRANAAARTTPLLQKVFSRNWN